MGHEFKLMILVENTSYRIAVNSQHCWEFVHRIPIERVSNIYIEGSVEIERIEFVDKLNPYQPGICGMLPDQPDYKVFITPGIPTNPSYPGTCYIPPTDPGYPQPGYIQPEVSNLAPVFNPTIPYAYPIYGGLKPGMLIYISGRPCASAYKFAINFQEGTNPYPPPDIAFHLGVRFYSNQVVRNARINDGWEHEENMIPHFPFQPAVNFDMIIRVDHDRFMVAIDGQHFVEFAHRHFPLDRFDTLYIENDIVVSSIRFA
ncbi:hypothetical protein JTE90_005333 [Oedothorax gibbosus]|uniref:Galectin n=1 Tax=Oedothorax gibbosus TaxID=931172 RepID=A0AAV6UHG6_9ARAC|nr:hypothetical protein JTE90_005333 [Oedothorax gibbosus]